MTIDEQARQAFDYQRFFRDMSDSERLQISREELDWIQGHAVPERTAEVSLNLSCGVQRTPQIMLIQVAILRALGVDFVATAGQAYCCGNIFNRTDRPERAHQMARNSIRRMASWRPAVNVQSCGSCYVQFSAHADAIEAETGASPFPVVHFTSFLLDTLRRLGDDVPWQRTVRRRVLLHAEGAEVHQTKEEARNAIIDTLALIPGVEYAGLVADPSLGLPCQRQGSDHTVTGKMSGEPVKMMLEDITPRQYRQVQAEIEDQARTARADTILTPHFACHREWCKFGSNRLSVMYYAALVAEALGIDIPDRFQILWRQGDPEKVLELTRPHWESWNIAEPEARDMVRRFFVPKYASAVEKCPCEGNCFETRIAGGALAAQRAASPAPRRPAR